jgi:hypothetical protein
MVPSVDDLLNSCPYPHQSRGQIRSEVLGVVDRVKTLRPSLHMTTEGTQHYSVICLQGTVKITYQKHDYNIPVKAVFPRGYPREPPKVYVTPAEGMVIKVGKYVSAEGLFIHPLFKTWNPSRSTFREVLVACTQAFSEHCPVYSAKPKPTPELSHYNSLVEAKLLEETAKLNAEVRAWSDKKEAMLSSRSKIIDVKIKSLVATSALGTALQELTDSNNEVIALLDRIGCSSDEDRDFLQELMPADPKQRQLIEVVSTEQACEDCLVLLQREFLDSEVTVTKFAKDHKEVAAQLFLAAKIREKIEAKLGG